MNPFEKGSPMPASIGLCADLLFEVRELRLAMEKEVAPIKARETEIEDYIIANLSKSDDTGAAGKHHRAQIVTKRTYRVADWGILFSWIRKNDRFDLLQKRLSTKPVGEFEETEGRIVPGCEAINVVDVSLTKI